MRDYTGKKYGNLTFVSYARSGGSGVGPFWNVKCDCGTMKEILARNVAHGRVKTCGKCEYTRRLMSQGGEARGSRTTAQRMIYGSYVLKSMRDKVDWQLTPDEFNRFLESQCLICGEMPRLKYKRTKLIHNHIDRVDPTGPYTLSNSFSCCSSCKQMKGGRKLLEFLGKVVNIHAHIGHAIVARPTESPT